jgi:hypothetical protein
MEGGPTKLQLIGLEDTSQKKNMSIKAGHNFPVEVAIGPPPNTKEFW